MKKSLIYCLGILLAVSLPTNQAKGWWLMKKKPVITVYIHGTRVIPHFLIKKLFHCTDGFHKASEIDQWYQQRKAIDWISQNDPKSYPSDDCYIFCWSGDLSLKARQKASKKLYTHLKELVAQFQKKDGTQPTIKLICHSHGCNVALSLAKEFKDKPAFTVDELIMLACPVQKKTAPLIKSKIFKKIYSVYSTMDTAQWLDPQWFQKKKGSFFSRRLFKPQANLKQTAIKINDWGIFHIEFLFEKFNSLLPTIVDKMKDMAHAGSTFLKHHVLHLKSK